MREKVGFLKTKLISVAVPTPQLQRVSAPPRAESSCPTTMVAPPQTQTELKAGTEKLHPPKLANLPG